MAYVSAERALHIAQSGMQFYTTALATASENLAATGVVGYKKVAVIGATLPSTHMDPAGAVTSSAGTQNPAGIEIGLGVKVAAVNRNFAQGELVKTDNALDLAINGDGFFQIIMPDGTTAYTRAGVFLVSPTGQLVSQPGGYVVSPGITFPQGTTGVKIAEDGTVSVQQDGVMTLTQVGQLQTASFFNPVGLTAIGDNLFKETDASGTPDTGVPGTGKRGTLKQGFTESSNSNTMSDVIDLMRIEKQYNFLTKVMNTVTALWEQDARIGA